MSLEFRRSLAEHVIFQSPATQRYQLTEIYPETGSFVLSTWLIKTMSTMLELGIIYEVTALRDDHRPDACLGPDNHNPAGRAMDFWFLNTSVAGDYMDVKNPKFREWVELLRPLPYVSGVGLGGSANDASLLSVLGPLGFSDNGSDHLHLQVSQ
jgi:hypothetical protein